MLTKKDEIVRSFAFVPDIVPVTSEFHPNHPYTTAELVNQSYGFAGELIKEYIPNTPVQIGVEGLSGNVAKVVVMMRDGTGFSTKVFGISKRTGVVGKLCDMFEEGPHVLDEDEVRIATSCGR